MCATVRELELPHQASKVAKTVTVSIGVACTIPAAKLMPQNLIEYADKALYQAKNSGRNQVKV